MPVRVDIPIRIRVDPAALTERREALEEALVAATGQALENSRRVVLAEQGESVGVRIHPPEVTWTGDGLNEVAEGVRAEVEECVATSLADAMETAGVAQLARGVEGGEAISSRRKTAKGGGTAKEEGGESVAQNGHWRYLSRDQFESIKQYPHRSPVLHDSFSDWVLDWYVEIQGEYVDYIGIITLESWDSVLFALWPYDARIETFQDFLASCQATNSPLVRRIPKFGSDFQEPDICTLRYLGEDTTERSQWTHEHELARIIRSRGIYEFWYSERLLGEGEIALLIPITAEGSILEEASPSARPQEERAEAEITEISTGEAEAEVEEEEAEEVGAELEESSRRRGIIIGERIEEEEESPFTTLYPPYPRPSTTETLECEAFLGEPSVEELGEVGDRLRRLIEEIAFKLQIQACNYPGQFCIHAAEALGARAVGVAEYFARPPAEYRPQSMNVPYTRRDDAGSIGVARGNAGNLGAYEFEPTSSPDIQFMRHLAGVTPLITRLSYLTTQMIHERHHDNIREFFHWVYRFRLELRSRMEHSVGVIFGRTCQILLLQLLLSSRSGIEQRRGNRTYAQNFERAIMPQLLEIEQLISLRDSLRNFYAFLQRIRTLFLPLRSPLFSEEQQSHHLEEYSQRLDECVELYLQGNYRLENVEGPGAYRCRSTIRFLSEYPRSYALAYLHRRTPQRPAHGVEQRKGEIVLEGNTARIWDGQGILWSLEGLEYAIVSRRGIAETFDPIIKQLVDLPEEMERFETLGVEEALRDLLLRMRGKNRQTTYETRNSWGYAFKASKINENLPGATVSGTHFELKGIHRVAHEQIGDYFQGDPSYAAGIDALFEARHGFEELKDYAEDVLSIGLGALSTICPYIGLVALGFDLFTSGLQYSEALERQQIYESLIDPELVISRAELEIELFVARFAMRLQLVLGPVGAVGDVMQILRRSGILGRAVIRQTDVIPQAGRLARMRQAIRELSETFEGALSREIATDQFMKLAIEQLLTPVIRRIARETQITGPVGGIEGMRATLERLRRARAEAEQRQRRSPQPPSRSTTEQRGGTNGD